MTGIKNIKEAIEVTVGSRHDEMSVFLVAGAESGKKRAVGVDGKLYVSCNDKNVIAFQSCVSYASVLQKYGLARKFVVVNGNVRKKVTVDENRRVTALHT